MRSALICVFFTLIVKGRSQTAKDDFKPTPIPIDDWHHKTHGPLHHLIPGTLHEAINSAPPAVVAAIPAHYWEDALRHSVYLTLVRDKIDELISKSTINTQPDGSVSKQVDDHDLWQKIKTAPFNRKKDEEQASFGDVTIVSKGRLLEDDGGYRFTEDEPSKDKCQDDKCTEGVKAFWSVKRVRQRDLEASPGKYHYELTFSVTQASKQQKKTYENPIRTFTVRESTPPNIQPEFQYDEPKHLTPRPARAIWFHKNIAHAPRYQSRQYHQGMDRIFSSIFDDSYEDTPYRHKPSSYVAHSYPQYSKTAQVGSSSEQHQQKRLMPYNNYKPSTYKYPRPLPAPPLPHYVDYDSFGNNPYTLVPGDQRYVQSSPVKTTRPAVLPTPPVSLSAQRNDTMEVAINITEPTTTPGVVTPPKTYNKARPTTMKISYHTDHVRPPVFNAPPGVFVTMDKKPFKPMPPMKLIQSKPIRPKPSDFRPSPQVLDIQFSNPDPLNDNAFRPITINYQIENKTEITTENSSKGKHTRRKPPKKHDNIKSEHITSTISPDIITADISTEEEEADTLQWANVVGAFSKTTPMVSQKEKANSTEIIAVVNITDSPTTISTTKVTEVSSTTSSTTTTTPKPKKRTRPPPKFKTEKKKHKRVMTSTTTTNAPEIITTKRPIQDLTPQASSSITGNKNHIVSTTAWDTTTTVTTTTAKPSTMIVDINRNEEDNVSTAQPKAKNRFRQSTLMHKGTSVNHDKWTSPNIEKSKYTVYSSSKNLGRRKGSNFHGYLPSSTPRSIDKERKRDHEDRVSSTHDTHNNDESYYNDVSVSKTENTSPLTISTNNVYANQSDKSIEVNLSGLESYYTNNPEDYEDEDDNENKDNNKESDDSYETDEQEHKDHAEYIFPTGTVATASDKTENEINEIEKPLTTQMPVIVSTVTGAKNKTKCKKKKLQSLTTTEQTVIESKQFDVEFTTSPSSTTTESTPDIFEELFGGFSEHEAEETPEEQEPTKSEPVEGESAKNEQYADIDKELEDFLDTLDKKENHSDENNNSEEYEDDKEFSSEEEDSPFNYDDDIRSRNSKDESEDEYHNRPYSLLELMAME